MGGKASAKKAKEQTMNDWLVILSVFCIAILPLIPIVGLIKLIF
jgi:hypothetical protein